VQHRDDGGLVLRGGEGGWAFEMKWDGAVRALASEHQDRVELRSRTGVDIAVTPRSDR